MSSILTPISDASVVAAIPPVPPVTTKLLVAIHVPCSGTTFDQKMAEYIYEQFILMLNVMPPDQLEINATIGIGELRGTLLAQRLP